MHSVIKKLEKLTQRWVENAQFRLARPDALLHLAVLGLLTGFVAGGVIVLFRLLVEQAQDYLLPGEGAENYEALSSLEHFLFPVIASLLLALLFYKFSGGMRVLGVARVMERFAFHQGYLTWRGFFLQFIGAGLAITGGHSVGREGPHVHLGASAASLFGQLLKLPNNSIRTLVASGAAAGIAASFNTPLAGVIFALEVIMMEYTLNSFIPVILAAVVATAFSNAMFGSEPAFAMPELQAVPLSEFPLFLLLGFVVGACAALFIQMLTLISSRSQVLEIWWRILIAGVLVGLIGLFQPEVLGIGYDTVSATLLGEFTLATLLMLTIAKLLATSICVGLGVPGGMIGPAFFIGATLGGAIGLMAMALFGDAASHTSYIGFYALLGMGAMMGASLQAPLAALTAVVELTYNPGIIMPGMLVIVVAQLTASELFNKQSLFVTMLRSNGLDYSINPVLQVLRGIGVASSLDARFERRDPVITCEQAELLLKSDVNWILLNDKEGEVGSLLPVTELAKYLQGAGNAELDEPKKDDEADSDIDLLEIPAKRMQLAPISLRANMLQAHQYLNNGAEALYVVFQEKQVSPNSRIYGILTRQSVDDAYLPRQN